MESSTSSIWKNDDLAPLRRELDAWSAAGLTARCWWRDDDVVSRTAALDRALALARDTALTLAFAAIPERVDPGVVDPILRADCAIWQHGWGHHFHDNGEFGEGRPLDSMIEDAQRGQQRLDRAIGPDNWQRVFVPPNHQLAMSFKAMVHGLGYEGVSAGVPLTPPLFGITEVNAEIDVMDWPSGRILAMPTLADMLAAGLRARRESQLPRETPLGVLTHHLAFDDEAWAGVRTIVQALVSHPSVKFLRARDVFTAPRPRPAADQPPVTVVITSCGRQDLLAQTLKSFVAFNTYAPCRVIVIEDGDGRANQALAAQYRHLDFTWLETGSRAGQIAAIDMAYRAVGTDYIFHCEDDWEFYAPGFIEKSMKVLDSNPSVIQVWLRALEDTNRHPVLAPTLLAGDVPYRILEPEYHSEEWGTWHGFSWNPGLRRRREYDLVGSFGAFDPDRTKPSYEVERAVSAVYRRREMFAAILADNDGQGYVKHLGWGRRVGT